MSILVTDGAGYIGSHTVIERVKAGYDVIGTGHFVSPCMEAVYRVRKFCGRGHVAVLQKIEETYSVFICNWGTGKGTRVLEMAKAFFQSYGKDLPYKFAPHREGALPTSWVDRAFAKEQLTWCAEKGVQETRDDNWNWQHRNPNGFPEG